MSPDRVLIARHGRHELTTLMLSSAQVEELVERMLKSSGRRRIDINRPFIDAMLPEGHRLHVVLRAARLPSNHGRVDAPSPREVPALWGRLAGGGWDV